MAFYIDLLLSTSPAPAIMAHNTDLVLADSHRQLWEGHLARFPLVLEAVLFVWAKRNFFVADQTGWTSNFVCVFLVHR